ncbi:MAG: hypothetical protein Q4A16_04250 [Lautropia sp.]|nr:hypothetical protein [Lautropia sp.]
MSSALFRSSLFAASLLAVAGSALAATPRADVARPTDFDPVDPGIGALKCKSGSLMSCGRQATGKMKLPRNSADKGAYRFVEEEFMFDTGVGIFLQTASAKDKAGTMEWRRRLAFRKGADGGFQLVQVGLQYRCQGGGWGKTVCRAAGVNSAGNDRAAAVQAPAQAPTASEKSEKGADAGAGTNRRRGDAAAQAEAGDAPGGAATAKTPEAGASAGAAAGRSGTDVRPSSPEQDRTPNQPLDARWRPLTQPDDGSRAAGAGAGAAGAGASAADQAADAADQPGAGKATGAETVDGTSAPDAPLGRGRADGRAAEGEGGPSADATQAGQQDEDRQGAPAPDPSSREARMAALTERPASSRTAGSPALIRLIPTSPSDVRSARGFSALPLSTENAVRLARPCEQPIDMCGQQVFDDVFSPDSYESLSPEQVLRESFIYADNPVTSAVYLVTMVNLPDEKLAAERVRIEFVRRGAAWVAVSAGRQLRCHRGESAAPADWSGGACE